MDCIRKRQLKTSHLGALAGRRSPARPPWTDEARIRKDCSSCGDCIAACPERILVEGPAGTPCVDFSRGSCTFCGSCASACTEGVFRDTTGIPWALTASVGRGCFLHIGISCQSCTDACTDGALRFDMRGGLVGRINVMTEACTGCGACVSVCPADAIDLSQSREVVQ